MNYYSAWTISSVAKLITETLKGTGKNGVYILICGVAAGYYLGYRKIREIEHRIDNLEFQMKFGFGGK